MDDEDEREFRLEDISDLPSWVQYMLCSRAFMAAQAEDDPENTLFVQLTKSEVGLVTFGVMVLQRLFPEFRPAANALAIRFKELSGAQEFFAPPGDSPSNEGS